MNSAELFSLLVHLLGDDAVRGPEAVQLLDPGLDPHNLDAGLVVFPHSTEEVQAVVGFCQSHGIALVPQGGRTGLAGAATSKPGQVVLSLARMNRILSIDPVASLAIVEAGVTLASLDAATLPFGLMPGIDLGARDSATIGGMISTNAGGIEAFRQGVMRARVSGLEAVLPNGNVLRDLAQVTKCNEGYDIKQMLIGAEGTLGVVTKAVLRLVPRPSARATAMAFAPTLNDGLKALRQFPVTWLLAFELMNARTALLAAADHAVSLPFPPEGFVFVVETEGADEVEATARLEQHLSAALEQGAITDAIFAASEQQRHQFWTLREDSWAVDRAFPGGLWFDVTVPMSRLDSYVLDLEAKLHAILPSAQLFIVGHLGDGNLHLTISGAEPVQPHAAAIKDCVYAGLKEMGGSFSAEHGIGTEKQAALALLGDPGKLAAMRAIKQVLDPKGIMNPGKVL